MSNRALVAVALSSGQVRWAYVHHGWVGSLGPVLLSSFADEASALNLVRLGSLSCVRSELAPAPGVAHSFAAPAPGVCVAYHRDRGEPLEIGVGSLEDLEEHAALCGAEVFVLSGGRWYVDGGAPLESVLAALAA